MDKIKILEDIGLKKVSDETHIEQKYIKYMVDFNFEKLNRINTLGFVKILSRAYKLDLDAWSEAFEEYWVENHTNDEDRGLFIVIDEKKQSKKLLIFILLVILIATFSMLFSLFQDKIDLNSYINQDDTSFEQPSIVEDTQKTLDEINSSVIVDKNIVEEEVVEDINQSEAIEVAKEIETNTTKLEEVKVLKEVKIEEKVVNKEVKPEVIEQVSPKFLQEAVIAPNTKLWVGVIYLDTKKRGSYVVEGNLSIDTSRDQIITTGHGNLNLIQDGKTKKFKRQTAMKFLVKDNQITEINATKFKELNEGKFW